MSDSNQNLTSNQGKQKLSVGQWINANPWLALNRALLVIGLGLLIAAAVMFLMEMVGATTPRFAAGGWMLTGITVLAIACVTLLMAAVCYACSVKTESAWLHVGYQIAAFTILVLSLRAFGIHHVFKNGVETIETSVSISEMAAIMILFVLAELGAFLGKDVREATARLDNIVDQTNKASANLGQSITAASETLAKSLTEVDKTRNALDRLQLMNHINSLHPDLLNSAAELIQAWGRRAPALENGRGDHITEHCWRTLLNDYLSEEILDVRPSTESMPDVPRSVMPLETANINDISYMATNIRFYGKFLTSAVRSLNHLADERNRAEKRQAPFRLCMAVVTPVLPAHWWNAPVLNDCWQQYDVIDEYRLQMIEAVKRGAQIDRVVLVARDAPAGSFSLVDRVLWPEPLLSTMLDSWQVLTLNDQHAYLNAATTFDRDEEAIGGLLPSFPDPVRAAATQDSKARIYPMLNSAPANGAVLNDGMGRAWSPASLRDEYRQLYGEQGRHWTLPIRSGQLQKELKGRHDFLFLGIGPGNKGVGGLWKSEETEWGLCIMSSMAPSSETMFLTIVSGSAVGQHLNWCRSQLEVCHIRWNEPLDLGKTPPSSPPTSPNIPIGASSGPPPSKPRQPLHEA